MSRRRRVYHPDLRAEDSVWLEKDEAHHLLRVLRVAAGDAVGVFDGLGAEREGRIVDVDGRRVRLELGRWAEDRVEPSRAVTLFQGLSRSDRMDTTVQKATEIGVATIRLFRAARSEADHPKSRQLERWRRIAREACKQSGRRRIPDLPEAEPSLPRPGAGLSAFVLSGDAEGSLVGLLAELEATEPVWLAVGPEGGLTTEELGQAQDLGWRQATLGPRTLRTETAGPVAVALALAAAGEL